jgi:hypothetical protein
MIATSSQYDSADRNYLAALGIPADTEIAFQIRCGCTWIDFSEDKTRVWDCDGGR